MEAFSPLETEEDDGPSLSRWEQGELGKSGSSPRQQRPKISGLCIGCAAFRAGRGPVHDDGVRSTKAVGGGARRGIRGRGGAGGQPAAALGLAANALHRSDSALGAFRRRKKAYLGAPKAITATAHKLARIIYSMLRYGQGYVDAGAEYYESQYRQRTLHTARRRAAQ